MALILEKAASRSSDYKKIKRLYKTAFPREERAPFFFIKRKAKAEKADMLVAKDGDEFVGFLYLVRYLDMVYLFYFAIDDSKRGMGYGSRLLKLLQDSYPGKRIFLAREQLDVNAANYAQRVKRHEFYLHSGFTDFSCKIKEASVIYDVMGIGKDVLAEEYDALILNWCGKRYKSLMDMHIIE